MKPLFILFCLLLSITNCYFSEGYHCGVTGESEQPVREYTIPKITTIHKLKSTNDTGGLNVFIDYTSLNMLNLVNEEYIEKVKYIFTRVAKIIKKLLTAKISLPLRFEEEDVRKYCIPNVTLSEEVKKGIEADLIVIPVIRSQKDLGPGVIASARACFVNYHSDNRPILGLVNVGSEYNFTKYDAITSSIDSLFHEVTHILVFSPVLWPYFLTQPVTKTFYKDGKQIFKIVTPKVLEKARQHFNCSTLNGLELEDYGGAGSAGAHWESRYMSGDYMTFSDLHDETISEMTLALFEDSGWYNVNYYTGGLFRFGKGEGCSFFNDNCIDKNGKTPFKQDFCDEFKYPQCTGDYLSKGLC